MDVIHLKMNLSKVACIADSSRRHFSEKEIVGNRRGSQLVSACIVAVRRISVRDLNLQNIEVLDGLESVNLDTGTRMSVMALQPCW